jgi:2-keto-4-pentenoate hydratase/2-oxohepta-3-ene-1,7-dioic acid hydratase in catechol pathway
METLQMPTANFAIFCRIASGTWRQVISQNDEGVLLLHQSYTFKEVWNFDFNKLAESTCENNTITRWNKLKNPLSELHFDTWGYAMPYPGHQKEVQLKDSFYFRKNGTAVSANTPILYRSNLDYEAEIGLLLNKNNPDRFGYVLVNDWTDRGIQVATHDADNMAPGFTEAKDFKESLHVGSLLLIGNESVWEELEVNLRVNGEIRQELIAKQCLMRPTQVATEIFKETGTDEWVFVATGTTDGIQFKAPSFTQKIALFVSSGFSKKRAGAKWLEQLSFLQPGDTIEFDSKMLGKNIATVISN